MDLLTLLLAAVIANAEPRVVLDRVAEGLDRAVSITHAGDGRLFITQQNGLVRIWDGTRLLDEPFLDIRSLTVASGERGLLSIIFHTHYAQNGFFYVNYTDLSGDTNVVRYSRSATNPNKADPTSALRILFIRQPFANHNGGQLQFGPDGYLYIGMGDGGGQGDRDNRAQNLNDLLGKMLRIDVDVDTGGSPYAIPPSNPFVNRSDARHEIWAYGLRNPWRFTFDRLTGDLWIADVGQGLWEEIDFQPATSIGGENYGWRRMEGTHCFNPGTNCDSGSLVKPVIEYGHTGGACSVTGGYVYRGTGSPRLNGMYLYGDYCNGVIWGSTRGSDGKIRTRVLLDTSFQISTFGEDVSGEVYVASYGSNGALYRIVDGAPLSPKRRAARH